MAPRIIPPPAPVYVTRETGGHPEIWLGRVICLALMVGGWLGFAAFVESWTVENDLLARGKTTVAKMTREEKSRARSRLTLFPRMAYYYEVEGREYKDSTSGKDYPEGQAITYLPEDPSVHRLGVIQPRSAAKDIGFALIVAVLTSPVMFGFFGFSVLSAGPGGDANRLGWRIILGLGAAQHALVFTTLFLVRQPFAVVLTQYVPAFVGGTIGALLGVRFFAGRWGIKLEKQRPVQDVREIIRAMDPRRGIKLEQLPERANRRFLPRSEPTDPASTNAGDEGSVASNTGPACTPVWPDDRGEPLSEEEQAAAQAILGRFADTNQPADPAPRAGTPPEPTQCYYVTRTPGGGFLRTATATEIRELLRVGALQVTCYATESDGRSFNEFRRDAGGRWRTLAELLAEWGETPPPLAPAAVRQPWHATPRAALAGAVACLLAAIAGSLFMHAVAFGFLLGGASWSWVAFFTSTDSILMDLILVTIATTFGAIRGVAHYAGDLPGSKTYGEIAERAFADLGSIRGTSGSLGDRFELIACLFLAAVFASPVIVILLLVWFRS